MQTIEGEIILRPLKRIPVSAGDVLHGVKMTDEGFFGFGEAYFSYIHHNVIKAWRQHTQYTANLICPLGQIKIMLYKEISKGKLANNYPKTFILSDQADQYHCLTIPPGIWYGFKGLAAPTNLIFSLLNGKHSPDEQRSLSPEAFPYHD